jgi:hypothetical protein
MTPHCTRSLPFPDTAGCTPERQGPPPFGRFHAYQETGWLVPALPPFVGDYGHGISVVAGRHAGDRSFPRRLEDHPFADLERQHVSMGPHLLQEIQTCDDAVVEVHQLGFAQPVYINAHRAPAAESVGGKRLAAGIIPGRVAIVTARASRDPQLLGPDPTLTLVANSPLCGTTRQRPENRCLEKVLPSLPLRPVDLARDARAATGGHRHGEG